MLIFCNQGQKIYGLNSLGIESTIFDLSFQSGDYNFNLCNCFIIIKCLIKALRVFTNEFFLNALFPNTFFPKKMGLMLSYSIFFGGKMHSGKCFWENLFLSFFGKNSNLP